MYHSRLILLIAFMVCAVCWSPDLYCEDGTTATTSVPVLTHKKGTNGDRSGDLSSSISVWLNTSDKTISIEYDGDDDAEVYILNSHSQVVSFSSTISSPLDISDLPNGKYTIYIEACCWYAYGTLGLN